MSKSKSKVNEEDLIERLAYEKNRDYYENEVDVPGQDDPDGPPGFVAGYTRGFREGLAAARSDRWPDGYMDDLCPPGSLIREILDRA